MAKKKKNSPRFDSKQEALVDNEQGSIAQADKDLQANHLRPSGDLIYESIMRGGGEPFGRPYSIGLGSLTERVVTFFKVKSFFGFETFESAKQTKKLTNKYTRYGASRYFGRYDVHGAARASKKAEERDKKKGR